MASTKTLLRLTALSVLFLALYISYAKAEEQDQQVDSDAPVHVVKRGWFRRTVRKIGRGIRRAVRRVRVGVIWSSAAGWGVSLGRKRRALAEENTEDDDFEINEEANTIVDTVSDSLGSEMVVTDYNRSIFMVTSPETKTCNLHNIPEHMRNVDIAEEAEALELLHQVNEVSGKPVEAQFDPKYVMKFEIDNKVVNVTELSDDILDICQNKNYKIQWMKPVAMPDKLPQTKDTDKQPNGQDDVKCEEAWFCNWIYMGAWRTEEYCCSATWFECERNCTRKTWLPVYRFKCGMKNMCNN